MSSSPSHVPIEALDACRPAELAAEVWRGNLDALRKHNATLAATLEQTTLPEHWRPALGIDDATTYRLERPGDDAEWLGHTAAPQMRAAGLLKHYQVTGKNLVLLTIGTGHELTYLLQQIPRASAVFVFEEDIRVLAAVLRVVDLAENLGSGRCVLVPSDDEQVYLRRYLDENTGVLAPVSIVLPNLVSPTRVTAIQTVVEQTFREVERARSVQVAQLAERAAAPAGDTPRVAVCALTASREAHAVAREVGAAAEKLGWASGVFLATDVATAHPAVHGPRLADLAPTLTICVNHNRQHLPFPPRGSVCMWHHVDRSVPAELPQDDTVHLAASPRVLAALERAARNGQRVAPFYWAAPTDAPAATDAVDDDCVFVVGDIPDPTPELYGIKQGTLKSVWRRLWEVAREVWPTPEIRAARALLQRAARDVDVPLREAGVCDRFVELFDHVIVPAVVSDALARLLAADGLRVETIGYGWTRVRVDGVRWRGAQWYELTTGDSTPRPRACVFAGLTDPLHRALLPLGARGWPLMVYHRGGAEPDGLKALLAPGTHYGAFHDPVALRQALELDDEKRTARRQQQAAQARAHITEHHTYAARLAALVSQLQG